MINFDEIKEMGINELNGGNGITKANMFMDKNNEICIRKRLFSW